VTAALSGCHGSRESTATTGCTSVEDARSPVLAEAPAEPEGGPSARVPDAAGPECDGHATHPYGCDYDTQACVEGHCKTCEGGTEPFMTRCAIRCETDRDCPASLICNFVSGSLFLCGKPAPMKACPRGQIRLRSDGDCWKTCKTDRDCPKDGCCRADPNSPAPICMGNCP
jgi:hypothetical protein